jgi:Transposase IS66 family
VEIDRSTLAEWVGGTSRLLAPLVEALRRHVLSGQKLHADDTPVPVLAPGLGKIFQHFQKFPVAQKIGKPFPPPFHGNKRNSPSMPCYCSLVAPRMRAFSGRK